MCQSNLFVCVERLNVQENQVSRFRRSDGMEWKRVINHDALMSALNQSITGYSGAIRFFFSLALYTNTAAVFVHDIEFD